MTVDWTCHVTTVFPQEDYYDLLYRADADLSVSLAPISVWDSFKDAYVPIPDRYVTTLQHNGRQVNWEVMKDRYEVVQNREILERAIHLAEHDESWSIYGLGTLDDYRKFFVVVSTGSIEVKSTLGHTEVIDLFIVILSSHDGSLPICYYPLNSRRSNKSVIHIYDPEVESSLRKRHTPSKTDLAEVSLQAANLRSEHDVALQQAIQRMYTHISRSTLDGILDSFWPLKGATTLRKQEHAQHVHDDIHRRFSQMVPFNGPTKLSAWFAICEYLDFGRDIDGPDAARQALEIDNYSFRTKQDVYATIG